MVKFDDESGPHYNYPGGGVERGETLHAAMIREVKEETGADVEVGRLLGIYEYVPAGMRLVDDEKQALGIFFECELKPQVEPGLPDKADLNEVAVEWIPLKDLPQRSVFPSLAIPLLQQVQAKTGDDFFLGNCYLTDNGL